MTDSHVTTAETVARFGAVVHLKLADGSVYALTAADNHAADIVAQCGAIMQLQPATGPARVVIVATDNSASLEQALTTCNLAPIALPAISSNGMDAALVCNLGPMFNEDAAPNPFFEEGAAPLLFPDRRAQHRKIQQISGLALGIARDVLSRGGLLLHGALAEGPCGCVILSGPSGVGKSTASGRLSPPWRSLSDDTTLVVRDAQGQYWAHPWPTWSRFCNGGSGGSWDVQGAVPLRGIFFLAQALEDQVLPLRLAQMISQLIDATQQGGGERMTLAQSARVMRTIYQERLTAVTALAEAVPIYALQNSLTGKFWEEIERVLPVDHRAPHRPPQPESVVVSPPSVTNVDPLSDDSIKYAVTIGTNMAPTLCEPDVLTIEPYQEQPVRRGDVVCFQLSESDELVQRVVRIDAQGIHTRSDHPEHTERHCLQTPHIVGRVVAAQRGQQQRKIAGGWRGHMTAYVLHLRHAHSGFWNRVYDTLAPMKLFQYIVPPRLKPRVLLFTQGLRQRYKIMMGARIIGDTDAYHVRQNLSHPRPIEWHIQPPFRLFIDEDQLPRFPAKIDYPPLTPPR